MRIGLYQKRGLLCLVFKRGGRSPEGEFKLYVRGGPPCFVTSCRKAKTVVFEHQVSLIAPKTQGNKEAAFLVCSADLETMKTVAPQRDSNNRVEEEKKEKTWARFESGHGNPPERPSSTQGHARPTPVCLLNMSELEGRRLITFT